MALHLETALQRKLNFKMTTVSACRPPRRLSIGARMVRTYGGRYELVAPCSLRLRHMKPANVSTLILRTNTNVIMTQSAPYYCIGRDRCVSA